MKHLCPDWKLITDQVMGGVSAGRVERHEDEQGCLVYRLAGAVSLDNNGGFLQMAADIDPPPAGARALVLDVSGNGEEYNVHLRTSDLDRPWQSYRTSFIAPAEWRQVRLLLSEFHPHRTEVPFDPTGIRRIGIVAIGRKFAADVSVRSASWA